MVRSSTSDGSTEDRVGHGTLVASTVEGTGAASGGRYVGVAPGARLLVGTVVGDDLPGQESWIIAGMERAVAQGVRVVNLSLDGERRATGGDVQVAGVVNSPYSDDLTFHDAGRIAEETVRTVRHGELARIHAGTPATAPARRRASTATRPSRARVPRSRPSTCTRRPASASSTCPQVTASGARG